MYNWQAEFGKFAPELDVAVVTGTAAQRRQVRGERHEVYVTSYDLLRHDVRRWAGRPLWLVALDEVQCIKNHETLAARAVKALDARHRLALTGTSIENRLSELWNIFDFLMPGLLGGYERFHERYDQPIAVGDHDVATHLRSAVGPLHPSPPQDGRARRPAREHSGTWPHRTRTWIVPIASVRCAT